MNVQCEIIKERERERGSAKGRKTEERHMDATILIRELRNISFADERASSSFIGDASQFRSKENAKLSSDPSTDLP